MKENNLNKDKRVFRVKIDFNTVVITLAAMIFIFELVKLFTCK